jgi:hypothetical protein
MRMRRAITTLSSQSRSGHDMRTPWTLPVASKSMVLLFGGVIVILKLPDNVPSELTSYFPVSVATAVFTTNFPVGETKVGTFCVWNRNFSNLIEKTPGVSVLFQIPYPSLAPEKLGGFGSPVANRMVLVSVNVPPTLKLASSEAVLHAGGAPWQSGGDEIVICQAPSRRRSSSSACTCKDVCLSDGAKTNAAATKQAQIDREILMESLRSDLPCSLLLALTKLGKRLGQVNV